MTRVVIHIDELVLKGFRAEERHAVVEGLRAELARQLSEADAVRGLVARGDVARMNGTPIRLAPGAKPSVAGARAAQRIIRGVAP